MSKGRRNAASRRASKRRPARARQRKPAPIPLARIDTAGRAFPGPEEGRRERSVQDPLEDWPETESDRWLQDREGEGVEEPGRNRRR